MATEGAQYGNTRRFSGESLDPKEYRRWKLWAEAKMASTKDMTAAQRGPFILCLLDGVAFETVEHLSLDKLKEENGDKYVWAALDERFPDKLKHDWLAECLKEIFQLQAQDQETMAAWTSRVQETFSKCRRKVAIEFPSEAKGWICLRASGLSEDQRAIITAKTQGELNLELIITAMRSCFPDFRATRSTRFKSASAFVVQDEPNDVIDEPGETEAPDAVAFEELEAFLAEHGMGDTNAQSADHYDEEEIAEVLAATWKEKRTEISRLQKARRFSQAFEVKQRFGKEVKDLEKRSRCRRCHQIGHWARNCTAKVAASSSSSKTGESHGAAMVTDRVTLAQTPSEVLLVSSPGYGILDSGCSRTLVGQDTLNQFMRLYQARGLMVPDARHQRNLFMFGNGHEELSERVVSMPVCIHGRIGRVEAAIIKGAAPLLLSRSTLKSLKAILDFEGETLSIQGGTARPLQVNSAGQYVLNVLDDQAEVMLASCETSQPSEPEENEGANNLSSEPSETLAVEEETIHLASHERVAEFSQREHRCLLAQQHAWKKERSQCKVAELFSPPRFAEKARQWGASGRSYDIKQGWDLTDPKVQRVVDEELEHLQPELLVCCPECKHWGGWYRLNQHRLPLLQQLANKQQAKKQAQFCVDQIKKQLRRGGRVLVEHPWNSDLWQFEPLRKLLRAQQLTLTRNDMCAYDLKDPQTGLPIKKPTGLAVSHRDMVDQAVTCPGHAEHRLIAGQSCGMSLSARCAEYTPTFVEHWLRCVFHEKQQCMFSCLQETTSIPTSSTEADRTQVNTCPELEVLAASSESLDDPQKVTTVLRRVHVNLGHPSSRDLVRIIRNAGGSEQAVKLAADIEAPCDICCQRKRPTPSLPAAPNHATEFNQRIGWDVKILSGWKVGQKVKCMNIVDYASSFQVMLPFFEQETADVLKQLYLRGWQQWAGIPEEVIVDPARTNTAETVFQQLEREGTRVLTIAAEAHNQLGKVEKHGHLFEVILNKVLDQAQPKDRAEYEQCVVQTMNAKNELISQKGLSPCQLVFGRNPRVATDLIQEQPCPVAGTQALRDSMTARSQAIRMHARTALVMAQDDQSMRSALNARPRVERDFLAGDYVAYWRSQKYEKGQRIVGGKWFGVAIVMGKVGRNFVVRHRRNIFKVAPEHLRHVTSDERLLF